MVFVVLLSGDLTVPSFGPGMDVRSVQYVWPVQGKGSGGPWRRLICHGALPALLASGRLATHSGNTTAATGARRSVLSERRDSRFSPTRPTCSPACDIALPSCQGSA